MHTHEPLTNVSRWKILGMLLAAPVMGAVYVVFLPCVGFYLVGKFGIERLGQMMQKLRHKRIATT